ncbi:formaldehyde-activating enzyme [Burkholderia plantarii]|uniref:formaldehyde-activating enzyme n=1 Tax=Burkholderia plantarii TaxID=41899 RepID=UPI0018DD0EBC|nr:formaldehyde-activating enzyme [Burkholderia plantarii]MBI0331273.1 formaldehyde-activating enzyme [Burkholderia plantarii]
MTASPRKSLYIGEGFEGPGANLAHVNVLIGPREGPARQAFATAPAPPAGHVPIVMSARPGVPTTPLTRYLNHARIDGECLRRALEAGVDFIDLAISTRPAWAKNWSAGSRAPHLVPIRIPVLVDPERMCRSDGRAHLRRRTSCSRLAHDMPFAERRCVPDSVRQWSRSLTER